MDIIVVGCGRIGAHLATLLSQEQNNVVVVDSDPNAFNALGRRFEGRTVTGLGFDEEVLIEAGIEECEALIAATDSDNSNLMIAEVARTLFGVPRVLSRLYNPDREGSYLQLGLDFVCSTSLVAEEMYTKIMAQHSGYVHKIGDYEILRFALDLGAVGKSSIQVGEFEREHEVRVVAFERKDQSLSSIPSKDSVLYQDDVVVVCVHENLLDWLSAYMPS